MKIIIISTILLLGTTCCVPSRTERQREALQIQHDLQRLGDRTIKLCDYADQEREINQTHPDRKSSQDH